MKIDHIAIAVNDVEESAKVYQQALGVDNVEFETIETEGVKVAIIHLENGRIELMQPTNDSSPIKKFLDKKGQGLLTPEIEIEGWWTTLTLQESEILELYLNSIYFGYSLSLSSFL